MELVASITKYRGNKDNLIGWIEFLPKKYNLEDIEKLLDQVKVGSYILWTSEKDIKILNN